MIGKVNGLVLVFLDVGNRDEEGLGKLVAKMWCLVQVLEPGMALDREALAGTYERIAAQMRRLAGEQLDDVDAKDVRALI